VTVVAADGLWVRARVVPARQGAAAIERVGPLTPYLTQMIVEDAVFGGHGSSVRLELRGDAPRLTHWRPEYRARI
jgi:hypothetical protein